MPEGDSIWRAARTLQRAIGGRVVTRFETVLMNLARVDEDTPLAGRTVESVTAEGKWIVMRFSGDLILVGSRLGQFVDPNTDLALMLFDPQDGIKLGVSPLNGPAAGWPEVTLEKCTG